MDKKKGGVICSTVDPTKYEFGFPKGVDHAFDYPFYFFDAGANAAKRIQAYIAGHGGGCDRSRELELKARENVQ